MSGDQGSEELKAILERPSGALEDAIEALATSLESAHGAETGGAKLPQSALAPISRLRSHYRGLQQRVGSTEATGRVRNELLEALRRMETGLENLAAAVGLEGEEARREAEHGAVEMERASGELERTLGSIS